MLSQAWTITRNLLEIQNLYAKTAGVRQPAKKISVSRNVFKLTAKTLNFQTQTLKGGIYDRGQTFAGNERSDQE